MSGFDLSFRLRPGVDLEYVKRSLREQGTQGHNVGSDLAGALPNVAVNRYLQWVSGIPPTLRTIFVEPEVWTRLRGDAFWHIRELTEFSPRWQELIYTEAELQAGRLDELLAEILAVESLLDAAEGQLAVIDTNVLLEHQPPEQIKWKEVVGTTPVRLVIPLRVLDELDEKKYTARDDRADWARRLLSRLWTSLGPVGANPVPLAEGVTVEVPVSQGPRRRTLDADQEVIDTCEDIRRLGRSVDLITGDYGMCIRASALGIPVARMPEKYLRRQPRTSDK